MTEAREYGKALFLVTEESGTTERVKEDVNTLLSALGDNPEYTKLLDTPAISVEEKLSLIDRAFYVLDSALVNLCKILCERRSARLIPKAAESYLSLYDESRGIERVEAITAIALTAAQSAALVARLEAKTGKTVVLTNTVDAGILGGMKLRYMGIQLDGTVRARLDAFEESLKTLII